jgi:tripeptidyl-peptidase-1
MSSEVVPVTKPIYNNLTDCSNNITPTCLRALYGIPALPSNMRTHLNNSFGIVQYTPQNYVASDLDLFFSNYSKNQVQTRPILHSVGGGNVYDTAD